MKRIVFTLACMCIWSAGLFAGPIVGTTSVLFGGAATTIGTSFSFGAGTITANNGGGSVTIGFSSNANEVSVILAPGQSSNVTLGVFNVTSISTSQASLNGATVNLSMIVSVPAGTGPQSFTGNLSGTITPSSSGLMVAWNVTTLTFTSPGGGIFQLTIEPFTPINPPSSPSNSRVRGQITNVADVPEPTSLMLLGTGLAGTGILVGRRKRRGQQA